MFYEWTDSLSVGVPSIDRQHKVLIGLINDLHVAIETGKGSDKAKFILGKLINYAKAHFIYEEGLFKGQNYVETEKHLLSHRKIGGQLNDLNEQSKDSKFDLPEELMEFLKSWLNNHILKEDMGYSDLLTKNNTQ
ncbi:MAG: hypothetical protein BMS9Abin31_0040 [Gammaproteobacteria bacterium]|nr:MAG: hypothetical protein BMS9Abin31_0040 [Gammaproteobacteria bacterium]